MIAKVFFWIAIGTIAYTYIFYPLLIRIAGILSSKKVRGIKGNNFPAISILMSVHNEEKVLEKKLNSLLSLDYPPEKVEILVGSDASTDDSNTILQDFSNRHSRLILLIDTTRRGKPAMINNLASKAKGEIFVITDANVFPVADSLNFLIDGFSDPETGLIDSKILSDPDKLKSKLKPENIYLSFESWIKNSESMAGGLLMGPWGGYYAVRKELYVAVPENFLADDFFINMQVLLSGHKAIVEPRSLAIEHITNTTVEFRRQVRISAGNFQNLNLFKKLLIKPWHRVSYVFISHKVLRWLSPLLFIAQLVCNCLMINQSEFFNDLFYVQLIFLLLPALDQLLRLVKLRILPIRIISHLFYMNFALFAGLIKFVRGIESGIWEPTKR